MAKPIPMQLRPSARLQKYLGRELIADPNLAVLEFVKNAYDAGAGFTTVTFYLNENPNRLVIADNGVGMDEDSFRRNWLSPGFSEKSPDYAGASSVSSGNAEAVALATGREPAGEKGLGRLSSGRLGERLQVWTRPTPNDRWLHVDFVWSTFDDMSKHMDEITIPFDYDTEPPEAAYASGTILEISGLTQTWTGRVPGRRQPGRPRTRMGRLRQDLEFLLRPLDEAVLGFTVTLDSDALFEPGDLGEITPTTALERTSEYRYDFEINLDSDDFVVVERSVTRSAEIAEETGLPTFERLDPGYRVTAQLARRENRPEELSCGPFSGTFYYTPPPVARRAQEIERSGVLLYRDGVLVEPYGLADDDWLGVAARKASRQGHAAIAPVSFSGFVRISRRVNKHLEDMSNRLGLLDNEFSEEFILHAQAEFARFEALVYEEITTRRWDAPSPKRAKNAARAEEFAQLKIRALVHRAGQPLQGLGFSLLSLENVAKRSDMPKALRTELQQVTGRIERHLNSLGKVIQRVGDISTFEFATVDVNLLLQEVMADVAETTESNHVSVAADFEAVTEAVVIRDLLNDAIYEFLLNALESGASAVTVSSSLGAGAVLIGIQDNGQGFEAPASSDDFSNVKATKGRPPTGLSTAARAVEASKGLVRIDSSAQAGTLVQMLLPTSNVIPKWSDQQP